MLELWSDPAFRAPSVMINVHPGLMRRGLPAERVAAICHVSRDETFQDTRGRLEDLMRAGSARLHLLYLSADSGRTPAGGRLRRGDTHVMQLLQEYNAVIGPCVVPSIEFWLNIVCWGKAGSGGPRGPGPPRRSKRRKPRNKRKRKPFIHNPQPYQLSLPAATAWQEKFVKNLRTETLRLQFQNILPRMGSTPMAPPRVILSKSTT